MSYNILDSSLITPTFLLKYNCKVINFGNYSHLYFYENTKLKKIKDEKFSFSCRISHCDKKEIQLKQIELKNINRSKFSCQRIALANLDSWETFITLTYSSNITDVSLSRNHFRYFVDKVRRIKKDFKYLCITEFQKRGAIHYHLLTNISYDDTNLLYFQSNNLNYKHIKYWNYGFTSIEKIKDNKDKIIGYISKYMTKDLDNRLFSKRRYLYSKNLKMPIISHINLEDSKTYNIFIENLKNYDVSFSYDYLNKFDNTNITFLELYNCSTDCVCNT